MGKKIFVVLFVVVLTGCATYYQKNLKFQQSVYQGNFEKADEMLAKDKKAPDSKDRLLYFLNRGYTNWMLDQSEQSNLFFQKADNYIEDLQKNYAVEALALISNPMIRPYKPEDFESVMLHYFTTLNYLKLGNMEDALVECRRVNIVLNKLNDKYPTNKNRYKRDAFAETLTGLIYDADKDYNNAFIAYRNALEIYETDYAKNFKTQTPLQLKKDLLRTAYLVGFDEDLHEYETKFNMKYDPSDKSDASLVFFWLDGFGPVKDEWSINFVQLPGGKEGWIVLANEEYGMNFPIYIGDYDSQRKSALSQMRMMRVAFPKYIERGPLYTNAAILNNGVTVPLEEAQNINDIAFKTLNDRMFREMATSIARLALKKAMEAAVDKQNQNFGAALSIVNAMTEKADTRNWQTLPYSISYSRISLKEGDNEIELSVTGTGQSRIYPFHFQAKKGQTLFHSFHNIEIVPLEKIQEVPFF